MGHRYLSRLDDGLRGRVSETRVAKAIGARLQPASGALAGAKSDSKLSQNGRKFRVESKSTINLTMPLDLSWLTKITSESLSDSSIPTVTISFVTSDGKPRSARNSEWVLMPMWAFQELKGEE